MEEIIKLDNQRTEIEWTPYLATAYAEGFGDGENASGIECIEALAVLIKTGLCNQLQGWFGRSAEHFIITGLISKDGVIDWEEFDDNANTNDDL